MTESNRITTIDCEFLRPRTACSYLIRNANGECAFVDNNTTHAVPILLAALEKEGLTCNDVKYVIITHVHLDHAGGTSALLSLCPNALLLAHPKAAPHMIDPSKLIRSAKLVYGEDAFATMYGDIFPIPEFRVRCMQDGEILKWGERELTFFFTKGHANHHFCVYDSVSQGVFTGDAFGSCYPALQENGLFIFPITTPTEFDVQESQKSIEKILSYRPRCLFLTHFGKVTEIDAAAVQLRDHLDFSDQLLKKSLSIASEDLTSFFEQSICTRFQQLLAEKNLVNPAYWETLELDLKLNAAGLIHVSRAMRQPRSSKL